MLNKNTRESLERLCGNKNAAFQLKEVLEAVAASIHKSYTQSRAVPELWRNVGKQELVEELLKDVNYQLEK